MAEAAEFPEWRTWARLLKSLRIRIKDLSSGLKQGLYSRLKFALTRD